MTAPRLTREMLDDAVVDVFPVLDLGDYVRGVPGAREKLAVALREALENVGFFIVVNHGVAPEMVAGMFGWAEKFHAQPLEKKMRLAMGDNFVGYLPANAYAIKTSDLNDNRKPELNEAFFLDRERSPDDPEVLAKKLFRELNKWPDDLPGFRESAIAYYQRLEAFSKSLLPIFATALGLAPDWFDRAFEGAQATLRLSHYPPAEGDPEQFGISPHTDLNFLTVLPQSEVEGLYVRPAGKGWMKAHYLPGSFVINAGDACRRWTNDRFLSTEHLAINPTRDRHRYAIPFFYAPHSEFPIVCLESCCSAENPARYPEITYADIRLWFMRNNYQRTADQRMETVSP
jgi:isopenicillin N synthase-like dioxygenase